MTRIKFVIAFCVLFGALAACTSDKPAEQAAQAKTLNDFELIPRKLFFGDPKLTQGRISPDGTRVSYIAPVDGVKNVWVAPLDDPQAGKPVTHDTLRGTTSHSWTYNDRYLLYMRDAGGNEDYHVMRVDLETGEEIDLTPYDKTLGVLAGGSSRHPDKFLIGMNDRDPRWHDIYSVDLVSGERELVELNDGYAGFIADEDLQLRLAIRPNANAGYDYFKRGDDGDWVEFYSVPKEDVFADSVFGFSTDGGTFYKASAEGRDTAALYAVDYETGEQTLLGASDKADVSTLLLDAATNEPLAYSVNHLRSSWVPLDEAAVATFDAIAASIPGDVQIMNQTIDGQRWVVAADGGTVPLAYYLIDRADNSVRKLFDTRPDIADKPLVEMNPVVIESRDGFKMVSYLSLPPHVTVGEDLRPAEPVPVVLWVHGGPWARDAYGYSGVDQWFANRGYATLSVNYRGSTGFGKAWVNAGAKEWAAAMHDDLIDAVNWAIANGITTADQVAIGGGSYGGYATLVGLTFTPETFACGVDIVGPSNLVTLLNSVPEYWESFREVLVQNVGDPRTEEGQRLLRSRSPVNFADRIMKPLLIGQGANDPRVKQAESDQIVAAMKAKDLPVTYVLYPDEGHGFGRAENSDSFFAITEVFLAECLGGRAEPFGDSFDGSSTTVPHGVEFIPGLKEVLSNADIIEKF